MGSHRAETRGHTAAVPATPTPPGGRRKATAAGRRGARVSPLGPRAGRVPALPTLVGAAALLLAGAGAIGLNGGQLSGNDGLQLSSGSNSTGTDAFAFTGSDSRARAISRDSSRQAVVAQLNAQLKQEAEKQNQQRTARMTSLTKSVELRAHQIQENRWVLPTLNYHLTARFGMTSGLWSTFHTGLDFATDTGTPIFAVANGVITSTGFDGPYGNKTVETLKDGTEIWYAHQSEIDVQPGDTVTGGQTIGKVGSTGNTTGPHVHIEVRPNGGDPVDPYAAFVYHGVTP